MAKETERAIPETAGELTPEWLTTALRSGGLLQHQQVTAVRQEVLGEGEGFLGDILRLHLTYDAAGEDLPPTVIAKLPKLANRAMGELLGAYERENCFYMRFGEQLPIRTPRMYYGDFDRDAASEKQEEIMRAADRLPRMLNNPMTTLARWIAGRKKRRYILLLEDVTGAQSGDQVAGADVDRCAEVLRTVARAHAAFWSQPVLTSEFWLLPLDIDLRMRHSMFRRSRRLFTQVFQDEMAAGLDKYVERVERDGVEMMQRLCRGPATLLHCDLRLDNLFFRDGQVIVFDWQLVRRGPGVHDVAYFLSGALDEATGADVIDALLQTYHDTLCEEGVQGYDLEALRLDYRLALHNVLQTLSTTDQVEMGDGRGAELMRCWIRRLHGRLRAADEMSAA